MKFIIICSLVLYHIAFSEDIHVEFEVEKYELENGLTVILHENHNSPLISYNTWFRVGSKDEEIGFTGIAHLFEHMMFKGTKNFTNKEFDRILKSKGASVNAFTSRDYTGYFEIIPSNSIEKVMEIESDRMVNLIISDANLKSELEVVKEERRWRVDDNVEGKIDETMFSQLFTTHSYHWPIIGWMKDLNLMTVDKCKEFYKSFYSPNNAVIIVAGDFSKSNIKDLIEKYYGHLKRQEIKRPEIKDDVLKGPKEVISSQTVATQYVSLSYRGPKADSNDIFALDLLASHLGTGPASVIYKSLVHTSQLATHISASFSTLKEGGIFEINFSMKPGAERSIAISKLSEILNHLRTSKISDQELQRARNQLLSGYVDSLQTVHGRAQSLAYNEAVRGSYKFLFDDLSSYNKVTADDILKVAQKYLVKNNQVFIAVQPKGKN